MRWNRNQQGLPGKPNQQTGERNPMKYLLNALHKRALATLFVALWLSYSTLAQTPSPTATPDVSLATTLKQFSLPIPELTTIPTTTTTNTTQLGNLDDRVKNLSRNAPRRENLTGINVGVKYINGLFGGFDQGAGFPFGVEFTTADTIPGVELRARALLSTRFYTKGEVGAFFPKIGSEKTQAEIWYSFQRRTRDNFFGIGSRTSRNLETNYQLQQRSFNATLSHKIIKQVEVGGYFRAFNASTFTGKNENDPPIETLFSGSPAVVPFSRYIPGLFFNARNNNVKVAGGGAYAEIDYRNDEKGLTRGGYGYARFGTYDDFGSNLLGLTNYGWAEYELDGRAYIPLASHKTSLALRAYADLRDPRSGKQVPIYEMPWLGGRSHMRGYQNFRFRGNNLLLLVGELRQTVFEQKETRGVDVFVFVDHGKIWGDSRSATNPLSVVNRKFGDQPLRVQPGFGVQYRYNKGFAARLDLAKSNERTMVYFSVSRGF
jgi:hypothetical protein